MMNKTEFLKLLRQKAKSPRCENCVREHPFTVRFAVFLCFACERYVCSTCFPQHRFHLGIKKWRREIEREKDRQASGMEEQSTSERIKNKGKGLGKKSKRTRLEVKNEGEEKGEKSESERMEEENERKLTLFLDDLMNESKTQRIKELKTSHISIYDRVNAKLGFEKRGCCITGFCGLGDKRWVACDFSNQCIKIFKLGSNELESHILFLEPNSYPSDVTEIPVHKNSTEPNLASGSSSVVSVTDQSEQNKPCLVAVAVPARHEIVIIDLSKKIELIHKVIPTEKMCCSLQFYDAKIFTVCFEGRGSPFYVYIISTDGDTLNKFDIGNYGSPICLAVASGRVYLTDPNNNKVQCRNVGGQFLSELTIEGSGLVGVTVDSENNVYVGAKENKTVYKLDAHLTRYNSFLDENAGYKESPRALCFYRNKLFLSRSNLPFLDNYVTVVQLL